MAIQETRKKITFTPFEIKKGREIDTSDAPTISISKGQMRFNPSVMEELSLNGKFIKMFYDPIKSVIGFQIRQEVSLQVVGKTWKMVRKNDSTNMWTLQVTKLLDQIDPAFRDKVFKKLPVHKYIEANGMEKGTIYYFVELNALEAEEPRLRGPNKKKSPVTEADLDKALQTITQD